MQFNLNFDFLLLGCCPIKFSFEAFEQRFSNELTNWTFSWNICCNEGIQILQDQCVSFQYACQDFLSKKSWFDIDYTSMDAHQYEFLNVQKTCSLKKL